MERSGEESLAGCTANVVLITETEIYCANAGDSRSILKFANVLSRLFFILQQTVALSQDHKPDDPKESNRISAAGGYVVEGRVNGNLNLSRALGDMEYKKDKNITPEKQIITSLPDITKRVIIHLFYLSGNLQIGKIHPHRLRWNMGNLHQLINLKYHPRKT